MTAPVSIVLAGRPPTINAERSKHWRDHRRSTQRIREDVKIQLLSKRKEWKRMDHVRVDAYPIYAKGQLPDTGACMPAVKAAIDGAVDAGLLADDTPDIVVHISFWRPTKDPAYLDQTLITFTEVLEGDPFLTPLA